MKQSVINIFDYKPRKAKEVKKSPKFKEAHLVKGYNGYHFFLDDVIIKGEQAAVQYCFYDGKWRQDTYYLNVEEYHRIINLK